MNECIIYYVYIYIKSKEYLSQMEDSNKLTSRRAAREYLFSLNFSRMFAKDVPADEYYTEAIENFETEFGDNADYIHDCYFGIEEKLPEIDSLISEYAKSWSLNRISKVSLSIMRICIYEMKYTNTVPKRVALNEAVELAKKYDDDKAPSFINGILNNIAHTLPDREIDK